MYGLSALLAKTAGACDAMRVVQTLHTGLQRVSLARLLPLSQADVTWLLAITQCVKGHLGVHVMRRQKQQGQQSKLGSRSLPTGGFP